MSTNTNTNTLDRRPLDTLDGLDTGRQVKLGVAITDARGRAASPSVDVAGFLSRRGYAGTIDQVLTSESRFPVTIPEGTRGIVFTRDSALAGVVFVWKTPKSDKVSACLVYVSAPELVNHRGAPPLPGEPAPANRSTSTTSTTSTATTQTTTTMTTAPAAGSLDAILTAVIDARVGARIDALEAELATRGNGSATVRVQINELPERQLAGTAHTLLPEALRWASSKRRNGLRVNLALVGDAGTGKSTLAEQVAESLGLRYDYLNCSGGVSESRLFGRMTPNLSDGTERYTMATLVDYYVNGGVYCLDEMDGLDANVLTAANGMFEASHWTAPNGEKIRRHADFILFATMNTYGTGASRLYSGRSQLDAASLDRWHIMECDYDMELERSLCSVREIVDKFHSIRSAVRRLGLRRWVTGRQIERAEIAHVCHGVTVSAAVRGQLQGWTDADLKACGVA